MRLLTIASGTTSVLHSLKTAQPLLESVAYFVIFVIILFSIIGVQSFKGLLRRTCVLNATGGEPDTVLDNQFCGGLLDPVHFNKTRQRMAGLPMCSIVDSEYFITSIIFILCVVVLNFWLINLFVAVITNTFSAICAKTKKKNTQCHQPHQPLAERDADDDSWTSGKPPPATRTPGITSSSEHMCALHCEFKYGEPAAQLAAAPVPQGNNMLRNSSETFISQSTSRKFLNTLEDHLSRRAFHRFEDQLFACEPDKCPCGVQRGHGSTAALPLMANASPFQRADLYKRDDNGGGTTSVGCCAMGEY
ncbi:hypothetical protein C8R45DRAFT_931008 [Mycena sanguinolenta]|nr:hypothetical protein C8R45DRAFT_931008 [Mycena sanguinolenta]